ncbi:hypothetical protein QOT17_002995 [Balamuthia mandrillaris]
MVRYCVGRTGGALPFSLYLRRRRISGMSNLFFIKRAEQSESTRKKGSMEEKQREVEVVVVAEPYQEESRDKGGVDEDEVEDHETEDAIAPLLSKHYVVPSTPPAPSGVVSKVRWASLRLWNGIKHGLGTQELPRSVHMVFIFSFLFSLVVNVAKPVSFLYVKYRGWASDDDIMYWSILQAVGTVVPIFVTPVLGFWANFRPIKEVFLLSTFLSVLGNLMWVLLAEEWSFLVAFGLINVAYSLKSVRATYIGRAVEPEYRTKAFGLHRLYEVVGSLVGPLITLTLGKAPKPEDAPSWGVSILDISFNRSTLSFMVATFLVALVLYLTMFHFHELPHTLPSAQRAARKQRKLERAGTITSEAEELISTQHSLNSRPPSKTEKRRRVLHKTLFMTAFLCFVVLLRLPIGVYRVSYHPILVNIFDFGHYLVSITSITNSILSLIPPLLLSLLSHRVKDRTMILFGLFINLAGMVIYSVPPMKLPQILIGYDLVTEASMLYYTASMSLFSKQMGKGADGFLMALINIAGSLGPAIGSLVGGHLLLRLYATPYFLLFTVPALLGFALFLLPCFYKRLAERPRPAVVLFEESASQVMPKAQ